MILLSKITDFLIRFGVVSLQRSRVLMRNNSTEILLQGLEILIADGNAYMRRLTRTMLMNLGAKSVTEAADGLAALEAIRTCDPDVMLLDWHMPMLSGIEVVRIVRSPGVFPRPNLPIIMLTDHP